MLPPRSVLAVAARSRGPSTVAPGTTGARAPVTWLRDRKPASRSLTARIPDQESSARDTSAHVRPIPSYSPCCPFFFCLVWYHECPPGQRARRQTVRGFRQSGLRVEPAVIRQSQEHLDPGFAAWCAAARIVMDRAHGVQEPSPGNGCKPFESRPVYLTLIWRLNIRNH